MSRKRLLGTILLIFVCGLGGFGYRIAHQDALDHDLFAAVSASDPERVQALLAQGANPNKKQDQAGESGFQGLIDMLLRHPSFSIPVTPLSQTMSGEVWDADHVKVVKLLLEYHANPNIHTEDGRPAPLVALADGPKDRLLTLLLEHGANPNYLDQTGTSLLIHAVSLRKSSCVEVLLKYGANPNIANIQGDVPLMCAARANNAELVRMMLARGADVHARDKSGQSALSYAAEEPQIRALLLQAGADRWK